MSAKAPSRRSTPAPGAMAATASSTQVHEGGAAHRAGMSAGDVLVAVDGLRVTGNPSNLDALLGRYRSATRSKCTPSGATS